MLFLIQPARRRDKNTPIFFKFPRRERGVKKKNTKASPRGLRRVAPFPPSLSPSGRKMASSTAERWFRELAAWLLFICAGADTITAFFDSRQELQFLALLCHLLIPIPISFAARAKYGKSFKYFQPFEGGRTFIFCTAAAYGIWGTGLVTRWFHIYKTFFASTPNSLVGDVGEVFDNVPAAFFEVLRDSVPPELQPFVHNPSGLFDAFFRFSHALGASLFFFGGLSTFEPSQVMSLQEAKKGHKRAVSDSGAARKIVSKSPLKDLVPNKDDSRLHGLSASVEEAAKDDEEAAWIPTTFDFVNNMRLIWQKTHVRGALICSIVVSSITLYLGLIGYYTLSTFCSLSPSPTVVTVFFMWNFPLYVFTRTTLFMHLFTGVVCHFFFGFATIPGFQIFEPFAGPKKYIVLQVLGWTFFGNATLFFYTSLTDGDQEEVPAEPWVAAVLMSLLSSFFIIFSNCCRYLFWSNVESVARFKAVRPPDLARVSVLFNLMVLVNLAILTASYPVPIDDPNSSIQHGVFALAASALIVAPLSQAFVFFMLPLYRSNQEQRKRFFRQGMKIPSLKKRGRRKGLFQDEAKIQEEVAIPKESGPGSNGLFVLLGRIGLLILGSMIWVLALCVFFVAHNPSLMCAVVGVLCALAQCLYYPVLRKTSTDLLLSSRSEKTIAPRGGLEEEESQDLELDGEELAENYSSSRIRQVVSALYIDERTTRNGPFTLSLSLFFYAILFRWLIPVIFTLQIFGPGNLSSYLPLNLDHPASVTTAIGWTQRASFSLACSFFCFTACVPMGHFSIRGLFGLWLNPFSGTPLFAAMQASSWIAHLVCFTLQLYMLVGDVFPRDITSTRTFFPSNTLSSASSTSDAHITQHTVRALLVAIGNAMLETSSMFLPYALSVASVFAYDAILQDEHQENEKKKTVIQIASRLKEKDREILKRVCNSDEGSASLRDLCDTIISFSELPSPSKRPSSNEKKKPETLSQMVHPAVLFVVVIGLSTLSFLLYLIGEKSLQTNETTTDIALVFVPTVLGFVTCTCAIIFAHALLGPSLHEKGTYVLWMPFRGGTLFMLLQTVGFGAYTASIVQTVFCGAAMVGRSRSAEATAQSLLTISLIPPALLSAISPILIATSSLFFIPEPKTRRKNWMHLSVYDNAEGIICLIILFGGWCIASFNDNLAPSEWASATAPLVLCCLIATICAPLGVISMRKSAVLWAQQQRGDRAKTADESSFSSNTTVFLVPALMLLDGVVACACFLLPVMVVYGLYWLLYASVLPSFEIWRTFHAYSVFFLLTFIALFLTMFARGFFGHFFGFLCASFFYVLPHIPYFSLTIPVFYNTICGYWLAIEFLFSSAVPPQYMQPLLTVVNAGLLSLSSRRLFCACMCSGGIATAAVECGNLSSLCSSFQSESIFGNDLATTIEYTTIFAACLVYKLSWVGSPERKGTKFSPFFAKFIRTTLVRGMERYFSLRVFAEDSEVAHDEQDGPYDASKQKQNYLFGWHPHGVLACSCAWMPLSSQWRRILPHRVARFGASIIFQVPFLRDLVMGIGGRVVTRDSIIVALREKEGSTCAMLVPGGQAEMIESRSSETRVVVKNHHIGFLRIAIQEQVPVVPVFCFGENDVLDNIDVPKIQRFFLRKVGVAFPVSPYGLLGFLPLPRPKPITVVVGKPISLHIGHPAAPPKPGSSVSETPPHSPSSEPPPSPSLPPTPPVSIHHRVPIDDDLLKELAEVYFEELSRVFYKYRETAGYPRMELILSGKAED